MRRSLRTDYTKTQRTEGKRPPLSTIKELAQENDVNYQRLLRRTKKEDFNLTPTRLGKISYYNKKELQAWFAGIDF